MQRGKREYRSRPDRDSTTGHATGNGRRVGHGCSEIIKVICFRVSGLCQSSVNSKADVRSVLSVGKGLIRTEKSGQGTGANFVACVRRVRC